MAVRAIGGTAASDDMRRMGDDGHRLPLPRARQLSRTDLAAAMAALRIRP
jgi:hypothetical protein